MSSGPVSRTDCFNQRLPALDAKDMTYKSVQASSETTKLAVPPLILRHVPTKQFSDLADSTLQRSSLTDPIATTFSQLPLESESDLVKASLLYAIHPIMEILNVIYPNKWTVHTELNDKASRSKLESLEDPATKQTEFVVRYDLVFKSTAQHANPDKTIAVLEYKRRELIRYNDFTLAMISDSAQPSEIHALKKQNRQQKTVLKMNGISYCKQVCRYAQISDCKHVALFNWQNLLLFNFDRLSASRDGNDSDNKSLFTAGDEAKISWVREEGPSTGFMEQGLIRKVLLGWLLKAYDDFERN